MLNKTTEAFSKEKNVNLGLFVVVVVVFIESVVHISVYVYHQQTPAAKLRQKSYLLQEQAPSCFVLS